MPDFSQSCLDFSEFHPLDHWIASSRCRALPKGPLRHLSLWWDYQRPGWDRSIDWEHPLTREEIDRGADE